MKNFISLLVMIFAGVVLYTAYQFLTFQPDKADPFVFSEPTLPPEIVEEQKQAAAADLSADEEKQKEAVMAKAQEAFDEYRKVIDGAPKEVKGTLSLLNNRMTAWDLPSYFLSAMPTDGSGVRRFEKLNLIPSNMLVIDASQRSLDCSGKTPEATVLVGSGEKDALSCTKIRDIAGKGGDADNVFIGGPDNDTINDATGNRIVNGGTGDDTVVLGAGRSIVILDAAWGHDTVKVDCAGATVQDSEVPQGVSIPWGYKTTNFIVLGDGIDAKDVSWKGNVLTSTSGDTLTVNENCFTVVPFAQ